MNPMMNTRLRRQPAGIEQRPTLLGHLTAEDLRLMDVLPEERRYEMGFTLYTNGEHADRVYAITSGMIKLVRTSTDGRQRIVRLLRAGDVAGIEALAGSRFDSDAIAMTDVQVCRMSASALRLASARSVEVHSGLMRKWHQALKSADDWLADLNAGSAGMRVRQFVLRMRHSADPSMTTLVSREDMGAVMGLKLETVSREVTALVRAGLIQRMDGMGRTYRIVDPARLGARAA